MARDKNGKEPTDKGTSLLEWISAGIGLAITIALLGFIGAEAVQTSDRPPILQVNPTRVVAEDGVHVVELEVANSSGRTAAAVSVEGVLKQGGRDVETSSTTLTFVPGHSNRQAGLIFTLDPRQFQLEVRATGYEEP